MNTMTKTRHKPQRKCVGCQTLIDKENLIRIIKNDTDGKTSFTIDNSKKSQCRGAYLCPNAECIKKAAKARGLERSFKTAVPKEVYENLLLWIES